MQVTFSQAAWEDYLAWQKQDRKVLKKINQLIADIQRNPFTGIGKPERLKYQLQDYYSRRITSEHRLVYRVEDEVLYILSVRYHYVN
ncbi:MAG: Txe/YoeB family addiction module toxin [Gammaproteobacteria bacterium]